MYSFFTTYLLHNFYHKSIRYIPFQENIKKIFKSYFLNQFLTFQETHSTANQNLTNSLTTYSKLLDTDYFSSKEAKENHGYMLVNGRAFSESHLCSLKKGQHVPTESVKHLCRTNTTKPKPMAQIWTTVNAIFGYSRLIHTLYTYTRTKQCLLQLCFPVLALGVTQ